MNDIPDRTIDLGRSQPRATQPKALQFALVMLGGCIVTTFVIGVLLRQVTPPRSTVASRGADIAVSTRDTPKSVPNVLVYHADPSGHFFIDAAVNGMTVRFLVDTGASVVALNPDDARAAGIAGGLRFSETVATPNGDVPAARASLRSVRLDQLEIPDVPAVVMDRPMPVSLLGLSFLNRLEAYSIRDGTLTIEW